MKTITIIALILISFNISAQVEYNSISDEVIINSKEKIYEVIIESTDRITTDFKSYSDSRIKMIYNGVKKHNIPLEGLEMNKYIIIFVQYKMKYKRFYINTENTINKI